MTVDEVDSGTSPHTGRQLSKLQTAATVAGSHGEAAAAAVGEASSRDGYLQDDEGRRWHVAGSSHSYSPGGGPYRFSVTLQEVEVLQPTEIRVDDFVLVPTTYGESVDDESGAIVITMRCPLDDQQLAGVRRLVESRDQDQPTYYPVVRVGVEERERSMRPGQVLWTPTSDGHEAQVVLVEKLYDEVNHKQPLLHLNEPQMTHALTWASATAAQLEALLVELTRAEVLEQAAADRVRASGEGALRRRRWDLGRVDDLDDYELD